MLLRRLARGTKKRSAFRPGGGLGRSDRASLDWLLESKAEENAMAETAAMNGAEWLGRALAQTGMTHVFFVESVMRRTLLQLTDLGVKPVLAHSEKAAAYMADGYARVAGRRGRRGAAVGRGPPPSPPACRTPGSGAARSSP